MEKGGEDISMIKGGEFLHEVRCALQSSKETEKSDISISLMKYINLCVESKIVILDKIQKKIQSR